MVGVIDQGDLGPLDYDFKVKTLGERVQKLESITWHSADAAVEGKEMKIYSILSRVRASLHPPIGDGSDWRVRIGDAWYSGATPKDALLEAITDQIAYFEDEEIELKRQMKDASDSLDMLRRARSDLLEHAARLREECGR